MARIFTGIILTAIVILLASCGGGEEQQGGQKKETSKRRRVPAILFKDLHFSDTITLGDTLHRRYRFMNDGYDTLVVNDVQNMGMGCTPDWTREKMPVLDTGAVWMSCYFDKPGLHKHVLQVSHNAAGGATALTLHCLVLPREGK